MNSMSVEVTEFLIFNLLPSHTSWFRCCRSCMSTTALLLLSHLSLPPAVFLQGSDTLLQLKESSVAICQLKETQNRIILFRSIYVHGDIWSISKVVRWILFCVSEVTDLVFPSLLISDDLVILLFISLQRLP